MSKKSSVSSQKQSEYFIEWAVNVSSGKSNHPIQKVFRNARGRHTTLTDKINRRYMKLQKIREEYETAVSLWDKQHSDDIKRFTVELKQADKIYLDFLEKTELNPIIMYSQGRDKLYIVGKIWWYSRKGFGVQRGIEQIKKKGIKQYYRFNLGRMDSNELSEEELKEECKERFYEKMIGKPIERKVNINL